MKEIVVYWACLNKEWMRAKPPVDIYKNTIKKKSSIDIALNMCPGFKDYCSNNFGIQSIFDYEFGFNGTEFYSKDYSKEFFEKNVSIRSAEDKIFSFNQYYIFFTEEKSLKFSCGIYPFLEDNNITKRCSIIPGTADIGKWFRTIDFAFVLKDEFNEFKIKEDEIFQYIKFHTDDKIKFKQFKMNDKLSSYNDDITHAKSNRRVKMRDISEYYDMFNMKKNIIKQIKENLVE